MDYRIVFSPDLHLSAADFAAAWNETIDCRAVAEAGVSTTSQGQFDPTLFDGTMVLLGGLALNVVSNALYDLIKGVLVKQGVRKRTEIKQLDQPDGSRLLVVTIEEK